MNSLKYTAHFVLLFQEVCNQVMVANACLIPVKKEHETGSCPVSSNEYITSLIKPFKMLFGIELQDDCVYWFFDFFELSYSFQTFLML